ncbi:MAG: MoaD/ThiS family protein [Anaerolineae bacterium]
MRLTVKLFATLGKFQPDAAGGKPFELQVHDGATVQKVIEMLGLPDDVVRVVFVNGRARPRDWTLADGDELGIFPPIGGG